VDGVDIVSLVDEARADVERRRLLHRPAAAI